MRRLLTYYLLGHPDTQNFGRKFKIAFSGCRDEACALIRLHDWDASPWSGKTAQRGFEFYVGGGLGTVPQQAKLLAEFVPEEELLPLVSGDLPGVCAFGREEEPQHRETEVRHHQARNRRVPPACV